MSILGTEKAAESSLQQALLYAQLGWPVFPVHSYIDGRCTCDDPDCSDPAKHPLNQNGCLGATCDPALISAWYSETRGLCNWGLATGERSGLLVVDVDDLTAFAVLVEQYGVLPSCPSVQTGREGGGRHYYLSYPPNSGITIGSGKQYGLPFDWRGTGGYVIAPPSLHKRGTRYSWLVPPETPSAAGLGVSRPTHQGHTPASEVHNTSSPRKRAPACPWTPKAT